MSDIKVNLEYTGITDKTIMEYEEKVAQIHNEMYKNLNDEKKMLGWLNLPSNYDKEEFSRILAAAERIKAQADVLLVIGIGGSYLGAKSAIEMLKKYFGNNGLEIIFVGHQISGTYVNELMIPDNVETFPYFLNLFGT